MDLEYIGSGLVHVICGIQVFLGDGMTSVTEGAHGLHDTVRGRPC